MSDAAPSAWTMPDEQLAPVGDEPEVVEVGVVQTHLA